MKINKINKLTEAILKEAEDDLQDVNLDTASTDEVADAIQAEISELSDGKVGISDQDAAKVAAETQEVADEVGANAVAFVISDDDFDDTIIKNRLYDALEDSYRIATKLNKWGVKADANIMVDGLPGAGKTAIVEAWCQRKGLVLVPVNATDQKLDNALNGIPLKAIKDEREQVQYMYALEKFAPLMYSEHPENEGKCILFVDEFNRQKSAALRRPLMSVFNEKRNAEGNLDFRKNLLFSVVCINPTGLNFFDKGTEELIPAEDNRFSGAILDKYDSNIEDIQAYWDGYTKYRLLKNVGVISPNSTASKNHNGYVGPTHPLTPDEREQAEAYIKEYVLISTLLNGDGFELQNRKNWKEIGEREEGAHRYNPLTSRSLSNYVEQSFGDKATFLYQIKEKSHITPRFVEMIKNIIEPVDLDKLAQQEFKRYKLDRFDKAGNSGDADDTAGADHAATSNVGTAASTEIDSDLEDNELVFGSPSNINPNMPIDDAAATTAKVISVSDIW